MTENVPTNGLLGRQVLRASGLQDQTTSKDGAKSSKSGRTLNPRFVEWLMGWPIGWTDFGSAETASSRLKPHSPSPTSGTNSSPSEEPMPNASSSPAQFLHAAPAGARVPVLEPILDYDGRIVGVREVAA